MRFADILPDSLKSQKSQEVASQAYPGDPALAPAGVDSTTTASINRSAVEPATGSRPRFWQRAFRAPVPQRDVGGGQPLVPSQTAAAQPLPPAQPFPAAPMGGVTRAPAPDPVVTQSSLPPVQPAAPGFVDQTSTGSIAPAAPAGGNVVTARAGDTLKKLSDRYGVSVDRLAKANGLALNAQLTAGQSIIIPAFGSDAAVPVKQAAAQPAEPAGKVPVPSRAPSERVAVLPQNARAEKPQPANTNAAPSAGSLYVVKSGDTLSAIAKRHGTTAAAIRAANGMESGVIRVGQKLVVPGGGAANVAQAPAGVDPVVTGATKKPNLDPIVTGTAGGNVAGYTAPKKTVDDVEQAAGEAAPGATGIGRMRWPVRGKVVSDFGDARGPKKNDGIDIAVPEGTPVKAAENGVVIYAGDGLKDFGNTVLVRHENGLVTVYGHASSIKVARGETVKRGQEIAVSGVSGNAGSPKLHFEVRKDSAPVDPAGFLE
jgi:murein DD-endopeptidase MepM/ murein hydrolase activator NlpD